jgi:CPA1 family monovalent cation:H+ antiporter
MILEEKIILLLIIAAVVALVAGRLKLPYTVALVLAGLGMGLAHVELGLHLTKDLVFAVFLPALLFEAAFHLDISHFRRNAGPILVLAVLGVIISILITGGLTFLGVNYILGASDFLIGFALVFGALISATDPISVLAIFKELGLPHRLNLVVEGESLFNDGTAVVMFSLILAAVVKHDAHGVTVREISAVWVGAQFIKEVFGGAAVGLAAGLALSYLTSRVEDHLLEIMLTTILAYGTYIIAEHLHVSGVIGVVAAGMMSGNYGTRIGMSPTTKISVIAFWEYAAFVVNSLIFLLIGMEVKVGQLLEYKFHILVAWLSVLLARAIAVNLLFPVISRFFHGLPWRWSPVLVWGGLRGSLSMALALSLDRDMPYREMIMSMTFGVVILSILGQALTIKPLLRLLGMMGERDRQDYEELRARIKSTHAVITELDVLYNSRSISRTVRDKLLDEYEKRLRSYEESIAELHEEDRIIHAEEDMSMRHHLLAVEKDSLREAFQQGLVSEAAFKKLVGEVDAQLSGLIETAHDEEEADRDKER